jgi:hypothetical protein
MQKKGSLGCFVAFILAAGLLAVFFGYDFYVEKYFITFHDVPMTRYLEVPGFATRVSPPSHELFGVCTFSTALLPEQAEMVLSSSCSKRGYQFKSREKGFEIEVTPTYKVLGKYHEQYLTMIWDPVLSERNRLRAQKIPDPGKPASATFFIKKKPKPLTW